MKWETAIKNHREVYRCMHCAGTASILTIEDTEKGTWPEIEFCPFCGLTNMYSIELALKNDMLFD